MVNSDSNAEPHPSGQGGGVDEPLFPEENSVGAESASTPDVGEHVRRLVMRQPYAVLCTQAEGQPYGALVAIAATPALDQLVFATPRATRKYRQLLDCSQVALVIDDRSNRPDELMAIEAVTATGRATLVEQPKELDRGAALLLDRHPHLKAFVAAPTSALFRVDVVRYFHVSAFQNVTQWIP